jgi:hypothetical protein
MGFAPILSRRICLKFERELSLAGSCVPVHATGIEDGAYQLYLVDVVVDCLDTKRSAKPRRGTGEMAHVAFVPNNVNPLLPAFRVPQSPTFVFWNATFVEALRQMGVQGLMTLVVWSEDPSIKPVRDPMR